MSQTEHGFCQCGCGERTNLAPQSSTRCGWVKGQPLRASMAQHRRCAAGDRRERVAKKKAKAAQAGRSGPSRLPSAG